MKKTISGALAFAALLTLVAPARAGVDPMDSRRTLFVPFGQERLKFEAPLDMCFLSNENTLEETLIAHLKKVSRDEGEQQTMAVFTDCMSVGALQGGGGVEVLPVTGSIMWLNPAVGETTKMTRKAFLDGSEKDFAKHAREDLEKYFASHGKEQSQKTGRPRRKATCRILPPIIWTKRRTAPISAFPSPTSPSRYRRAEIRAGGVVADTVIRNIPVEFLDQLFRAQA